MERNKMGVKVKVLGVMDGNTFVAKIGNERQKMYSLAGSIAPKKGCTGFREARDALEALIVGREVVIEHRRTGHHGMPFVDAKVDGKNVSDEMLAISD